MKKNMILVTSLAFVGTIALATATAIFNNNDLSFANAADNNVTVGHTITFVPSNINVYYDPETEFKGFVATKEKGTRSGFDFTLDGYVVDIKEKLPDGKIVYAEGSLKAKPTDEFLLYCETVGDRDTPSNFIELGFWIYEIASFDSIVLHGELYEDKEKENMIESYTFTPGDGYCVYKENSHEVEVENKSFFKAYIRSIDINYSCYLY